MKQVDGSSHLALVIEDEVPFATIFSKALEFAGYETNAIFDGQEALDQLKSTEQPPALVLLDIHLPLVSGGEILQYIRADKKFSKTRVIMATSDSSAVLGEIERNADLVLLKPISYIQLRDLASRFR